jgi:alpha-tubulin suppressor-like RCC1 family protein
VAADGEVYCWGADELGQTGHGTVSGEPQMPAAVVGVSDAVDVAVGSEHACALDAHGFVWCWGNNAHGELGSAPSEPRGVAGPVEGLGNIVDLSAGLGFTCAVDDGGRVWCWGRNDAAQLGDPTGEDRGEPRPVEGLRARRVSAGFLNACAIALDGVVWCWGVNAIDFGDFPEDGEGHEVVAHARPTSLRGIVEIAPGPRRHSCARTTAGKIVCWGQGGRPELGRPTPEGYASPGEVEGLP